VFVVSDSVASGGDGYAKTSLRGRRAIWLPKRSAISLRTVGIRVCEWGKRARVPVLVTLRVCADGCRIMLDMRIAGRESETAGWEMLQSLIARRSGYSGTGRDRR